jgi:hypothetical protein
VYLNSAPGLINPVSMVMGFPAHATDRSNVQVSLTDDLSKFLKVQTVGLLQQRPAEKPCAEAPNNIQHRLKRRMTGIVMIPKP